MEDLTECTVKLTLFLQFRAVLNPYYYIHVLHIITISHIVYTCTVLENKFTYLLTYLQRQFINVQYRDVSKVVNMVRIGESIEI